MRIVDSSVKYKRDIIKLKRRTACAKEKWLPIMNLTYLSQPPLMVEYISQKSKNFNRELYVVNL